MGRTQQYRSIILRAHDVGEADRFCILLTQERGKIAARARGVRRPASRFGGSLLPLQEVVAEVREGSAGMQISGAFCTRNYASALTLGGFLEAEQGVELLLSLLEDDHPVPEIFALMQEFLDACERNEGACFLPFTIRLLQQLGVFPLQKTHQVFAHLTENERRFVHACAEEGWRHLPPADTREKQRIHALCLQILGDQTNRQPRSAAVAQAVRMHVR